MTYYLETSKDRVFISDIGVLVSSGSPVWVTVEQYKKSVLLQRLVQKGIVTATRKERSRVSKPKTKSHSVRLSRPRKDVRRTPAPKRVDMTADELELLLRETAKNAAAQAATMMLQNLPKQEPQQIVVESAAPDLAAIEEALDRAVQKAVDKIPTRVITSEGSASATPSGGPEEPIYIPTGFVSQDSKDTIRVKSEASEGGGLGDAAQALKRLRKEKKK